MRFFSLAIGSAPMQALMKRRSFSGRPHEVTAAVGQLRGVGPGEAYAST
jgi:hypothetical protein